MSSPSNTASTPFDFVEFFSAASAKYTKKNGKDFRRFLREHPLASGIDRGDRDSVLDIFQEQAQALEESREGDTGLFGWLKRIVDLLNDISEDEDFEDCLSFVSPAIFLMIHSVYFTDNSLSNRYFGIQSWFTLVLGPFYLCVSSSLSPTTQALSHIWDRQAAKHVSGSYDALVDIFECIETFLSRLRIYAEISPTPAMTEMMVKILVELLSVLTLATKQINKGRFSMSVDSILAFNHSWLTYGRKIREERFGRKGCRISAAKAR